MWYNFVPLLSVNKRNFGQKLLSWTAHHNLLENRHPEGTKNPYYICPLREAQKKVHLINYKRLDRILSSKMTKFLKQFIYAMHKKVKQKISLCIFWKIWSFDSKVRNFNCCDILESITLFKAINILKNTLNMKKTSSQHLLKMNKNIWM